MTPDELTRECLGLDACPGGWACVIQRKDGDVSVEFTDCLSQLFRSWPDAIIGIDIPVGLPDQFTGIEPGIRQCDKLARKLLGFPRSTSVFSSPVRPVLEVSNKDIALAHDQASVITERISNRRITRQTMNILPRIREVDEILQRSEAVRNQLFEVHPELIFMEMNGSPMTHGKRTPQGVVDRSRCLETEFGSACMQSCIDMIRNTPIKLDDLHDALACCWTARRILHGHHREVPANPEQDSTGLSMAIHF